MPPNKVRQTDQEMDTGNMSHVGPSTSLIVQDHSTAPASRARSKIESLPNELLVLIVQKMGNRTENDRRDLARLCVTSKHFGVFTRPAQYRNLDIAYKDPHRLLLLLRSLLEDETRSLGDHVKRVNLIPGMISSKDFGYRSATRYKRPGARGDCFCLLWESLSSILTREQARDLGFNCQMGRTYWQGPIGHTFMGLVCFQILRRVPQLTTLTIADTSKPGFQNHYCERDSVCHGSPMFTWLFRRIEASIALLSQGTVPELLSRLERIEIYVARPTCLYYDANEQRVPSTTTIDSIRKFGTPSASLVIWIYWQVRVLLMHRDPKLISGAIIQYCPAC